MAASSELTFDLGVAISVDAEAQQFVYSSWHLMFYIKKIKQLIK